MKWKLIFQSIFLSFIITSILSLSVTFISIGNKLLSEDFVKIMLVLISPLLGVTSGYLFYIRRQKPKYQLLFGFLYYLIVFALCFVVSLFSILFIIGAPPS